MSTLQKENLRFVSDSIVGPVKRSYGVDRALLNPTSSTCLVDGEWFTLDSSGDGASVVRATAIGSVGAENTHKVVAPYWGQVGMTDSMGMASPKITLLWDGNFELETRIFDATAVVGGGLAITTLEQPLKIATITFGGRNFVGLVGSQTSDSTAVIVGYATRLPANNSGFLRFRKKQT